MSSAISFRTIAGVRYTVEFRYGMAIIRNAKDEIQAFIDAKGIEHHIGCTYGWQALTHFRLHEEA